VIRINRVYLAQKEEELKLGVGGEGEGGVVLRAHLDQVHEVVVAVLQEVHAEFP